MKISGPITMGAPKTRDGTSIKEIMRDTKGKSIVFTNRDRHDRAEFGSKAAASENKIPEAPPKESASEKETVKTGDKAENKHHAPHNSVYNRNGTIGADKIREIKSDMKGNLGAFRKMVESNLSYQAKHAGKAGNGTLKSMLKGVIGNSPAEAQSAISEDGEWGAKKTAERILNFAIGLSGGDPEKIGLLKNAVLKGFAAAEKIWGGGLPGVCYETRDRIMAGFDEWERTGSAQAAQEFMRK
ncbi:MAG: hypothetical protein FWG94_04730 [Oscillospiraceae bacterium]|nr:hypothetical protein [Oscillospiraceae bacterium]